MITGARFMGMPATYYRFRRIIKSAGLRYHIILGTIVLTDSRGDLLRTFAHDGNWTTTLATLTGK